jgi:anti-anti-sigma factor
MRAVHLVGRLDASTASEVRTALHRAALEGDGPLVLDLADVTQLDVVGLGVLVGLCDRAHRMGRRVVVTHVPPRIAFTLRVTGLNRVLPTAA